MFCSFLGELKKQARKGFRPLSGYSQNLRNFLKIYLDFFLIFGGFFLEFLGRIVWKELFERNVLGEFFWETFFGKNTTLAVYCTLLVY